MQRKALSWRIALAALSLTCAVFANGYSTSASAQTNLVNVKLAWDYDSSAGAAGFVLWCGLSSHAYTTPFDAGYPTSNPLGYQVSLIKGAINFCAVAAYDTFGDRSPFSNEVAISVTDAGAVSEEVPLRVQAVSLTPTGLKIRFNRMIDYGALDINSWQPNGDPDVTLVNSTNDPVHGSLVIHPDKQGFTFVKTGDVLAADSYTLKIVSRSDSLLDLLGRSIDGKGNGNFDNYELTLPVPASSSPVVGIGEFARGPGQPVNFPLAQDNAGFPVTITNGAGVNELDFVLLYDPNLLAITAVTPGITGTPSLVGDSKPGAAHIHVSNVGSLSNSPAVLLSLHGSVPAGAPYRSAHVLDIDQLKINGTTGGRDDDGLHVVAFPGDSSGNGSYTSLDPQLTKRVVDGIDGGFSAYRLIDPTVIADVNGDGVLDVDDEAGVVQLCSASVTGSSYWNVTRALRCSVIMP